MKAKHDFEVECEKVIALGERLSQEGIGAYATLDACPHCGGDAYFGDVEGSLAIRCDNCSAAVLAGWRSPEGEILWDRAAKEWNARALPSHSRREGEVEGRGSDVLADTGPPCSPRYKLALQSLSLRRGPDSHLGGAGRRMGIRCSQDTPTGNE